MGVFQWKQNLWFLDFVFFHGEELRKGIWNTRRRKPKEEGENELETDEQS